MVRKIVLSLAAILSIGCFSAFGQNKQITGTVSGEDGLPIAGATVWVEGTQRGTNTNAKGEFTLQVPADAVVSVSFIGYESQNIPIAGLNNLDVKLKEEQQTIDDVIVVAFGTAKKEAFTGSAKVIGSEELGNSQVSNAVNALVGKVAGVQIVNSSGQPGAGSAPSVRIRGFGSITASQAPLIVLDGIPFDGDMNTINPNDIESMTVLKDAASNALYGARGANGVIMITTKQAKGRDAQINVDIKLGVNSRAAQDYEYITSPAEFYETHYAALYNDYRRTNGYSAFAANRAANADLINSGSRGLKYQVYTVPKGELFIGTNGKLNPNATLGYLATTKDGEFWLTPDDWTKEAYKNTLRQEYNASVSGGSDRVTFYASFGYLNDKGIVEKSDYDRFAIRLKTDYQAKKWLKVGANVAYTNYSGNMYDDASSSNSSGNVFAFTAQMAPIYPLYIRDNQGNIMVDERGIKRYDYGDKKNAGLERPFMAGSNALSDVLLNESSFDGNALNGNGFAEVSFLKDFKFTFNAGVSLDESRSTSFTNPYYGQYSSSNGIIGKSHVRQFALNLQELLTYQKTIADAHTITAMIGHENYSMKSYSLSGSKSNMFSPSILELNGAVTDGSAASSMGEYLTEGYFGRVQYDYLEKIFFSASYRRDASSKFHPKHRWGNFWSVGAAWLIDREPWFKASWVDMLKIKASYGSQGNDGISSYLYTDTYAILNSNGEVGTIFNVKGNENITWETNANLNVGVEFGLFGHRLDGSIDFFNRKTTDMLFTFAVPPSMGYSFYYDNIGDMRNLGVEVELNGGLIRTKNVQWDINLNMTHMKNKIVYLPDEKKNETAPDGTQGYASGNYFYGEGKSIYSFYMPKYAGVNENGESTWYVYDEATGEETTTNVYSSATRYICDNSIPDLYGGFGTTLQAYGFDLTVNFTYQIGGLAYDSGYQQAMYSPSNGSMGSNWHKDILTSWSEQNRSSNIPRLQYGDNTNNSTSDRFLTDASYLNLQNINVGYTLPRKISRKFFVERLRIYLSCENVYYWSRRKGFDPRMSFSGSTSATTYSPIRTISGGINITF